MALQSRHRNSEFWHSYKRKRDVKNEDNNIPVNLLTSASLSLSLLMAAFCSSPLPSRSSSTSLNSSKMESLSLVTTFFKMAANSWFSSSSSRSKNSSSPSELMAEKKSVDAEEKGEETTDINRTDVLIRKRAISAILVRLLWCQDDEKLKTSRLSIYFPVPNKMYRP